MDSFISFSDAKKYWQKESWLNLSFWHYMIGNGLANIYIHNWIRMDPLRGRDPSNPFTKPLQHVSTLCRQLVFDLVFIAENIILLCVAVNSNVKELQEQKIQLTCILLVFCILECVKPYMLPEKTDVHQNFKKLQITRLSFAAI